MKHKNIPSSSHKRYLTMLARNEEDIYDLRKRIKENNDSFTIAMGILCLGLLLVSLSAFNLGLDIGEKKGKQNTEQSCVSYFCEKGLCSTWADYDYIKEVCNKITTYQSIKYAGGYTK